MKTALIAGVVLGVSISLWSLVLALTGWFADPVWNELFWIGVAIQVAVLAGTLVRTRNERGFGGQLVVGLATSVIAALLVFGSTMVFTTLAFPDYLADVRVMREQMMLARGVDPMQARAEMEAVAELQTPLGQAFAAAFGTVVTGLFASIALALALRRRGPARGVSINRTEPRNRAASSLEAPRGVVRTHGDERQRRGWARLGRGATGD